jgi:hypothetical protein
MALLSALLAVALAEDQCLHGDGICLAEDLTDWDEESVMLLQTRAFLERPPLTVAEGMQVELHAVELKADVQTVPGIPADARADLALEGVSPPHEPPARGQPPVERPHASLLSVGPGTVEQKAGPSVEEPSPIIVAAQPAASAVSRGDVALSNSTGVVPAEVAEEQKKVNLEKLATLVAEAAVLLIGEICRRLWVAGAVEATSVGSSTLASAEASGLFYNVSLLFFGFPATLWLMHRCCWGKKQDGTLALAEKHPFMQTSETLRDVEPEEMEDLGTCVFETIGCALEHTGSQAKGETVMFRSLAINATGLAYTALGRPTSSGRWRVELLDRKPAAVRDTAAAHAPTRASELAPLDSVLLGVLPDQDVAAATDELAGHWAFVSAARGRGFAYSPAGAAIRRGVETPCSATEVDAVLELALDAPRRAFEVFRLSSEPDTPPELLCSFVGIRPGTYRLAVSLRCGGIRVTDVYEPPEVSETD